MKLAARAQAIEPFYVMEVAKQARALEAQWAREADETGAAAPRMIYLNIGEPDFSAPPAVQAAATAAMTSGRTQYTPALGVPELREAISRWYAQRFGVQVPAARIAITAGATAALQLACMAFVDAGQELLMPDPSYPCNRHILTSLGAHARLLPSSPAQRFQTDAATLQTAWGADTAGVLLASPSNPTGTSLEPNTLRPIHQLVRQRQGVMMVDEIYLGLSHDERFGQTALALGDDVVSINSFSKYFSMTGWRLGWLVVPEAAMPAVERLAQNHYICASAVAQYAALACFKPDTLAIYEARRAEYKARRDFFVSALRQLGFHIPVEPDGAFYVWADVSQLLSRVGAVDSGSFVQAVMQRAQLVLTPSQDFSPLMSQQGTPVHYVRFSTASSMADLQEAIARLRRLLG
jgi:aspartate/methionine/tyrosine aminotransferase